MPDTLYKADGTQIDLTSGGGAIVASNTPPNEIAWIDTSENTAGVASLDNSHWFNGYLTINGSATSINSQGEMFNKDFIRVVGGKTYRFSSSKADWQSSWMAVSFYSDADVTYFISRLVKTTLSHEYVFTAPDNAKYCCLTSRNMSDGSNYLTATFEEVV